MGSELLRGGPLCPGRGGAAHRLPTPTATTASSGWSIARAGAPSYTGAACHEVGWAGRPGPNFAAPGEHARLGGDGGGASRRRSPPTHGSPLARSAARVLPCRAGRRRRSPWSAGRGPASSCAAAGGYGGGSDRLVDLRVDDHAAPIEELAAAVRVTRAPVRHHTGRGRGSRPTRRCEAELRERLIAAGLPASPTSSWPSWTWAHTENLEQRVRRAGQDRPGRP